jgi:hypothetical protein
LMTNNSFLGPFGDVTGQAYLMTAIGPGTTVASQAATAPFFVPGTLVTPTSADLFSGLSLGPGTYYLLLTVPPHLPFSTGGPRARPPSGSTPLPRFSRTGSVSTTSPTLPRTTLSPLT